MLDIIGAMALTAGTFLFVSVLSLALARQGVPPARFAGVAFIWFLAIAALGASGVFAQPGAGTMAIGAAVLAPLVIGTFLLLRPGGVRTLARAIPLPVLVGVHAGRLLGAFFLFLLAAGRLPPTFSLSAGLGDMLVGLLALPLAWAIYRQARGWEALTLAWNTLGLVDLVTALTLGVGSAPNSPLRFIYESPNSGAIGTLPWILIPALLVPIFLLTHIAIYARVAESLHAPHGLSVHTGGGQVAH